MQVKSIAECSEHSAILSIFIRLPFVIKNLVLSIFEWPFYTGFTVLYVRKSKKSLHEQLGVFHANQTSMCLDPLLNLGRGWCRETGLSPPVKYFYWPFQGGTSFVDHTFCVIYVLCLACFRVCSLLPCGHLLAKGWRLGPCLWCLIVLWSLSQVASSFMCGLWLYWFLISLL